jgi:hypothetical protein
VQRRKSSPGQRGIRLDLGKTAVEPYRLAFVWPETIACGGLWD